MTLGLFADNMKIQAVTNAQQILDVSAAAHADGHYAVPATDFWTDDAGEIRGYFAFNNIPVGHFWMHRKSKPRDSYRMIKACEQLVWDRGFRMGMIACHNSSPFHAQLTPHFGFKKVADTTLFYKDLTNAYSK